MASPTPESIDQLVEVAKRLRIVRAARRHFLTMWAMECATVAEAAGAGAAEDGSGGICDYTTNGPSDAVDPAASDRGIRFSLHPRLDPDGL